MSYDVSIIDPVSGDILTVDTPHHVHGGTYEMGGTRRLWTNETCNYASLFKAALGGDGIWILQHLDAVDCIPILEKAISRLGDAVDKDYWKPTEGNAKRALFRILALCKMRPDGIVEIS